MKLILKGGNICIDQAIMFFKSELVKFFEIASILFSKHLKNIFYMPSTELGTRDKKKIKSDIKGLIVIWRQRSKIMIHGQNDRSMCVEDQEEASV